MSAREYEELDLVRWQLHRTIERSRYISMVTTTLLSETSQRLAEWRTLLRDRAKGSSPATAPPSQRRYRRGRTVK